VVLLAEDAVGNVVSGEFPSLGIEREVGCILREARHVPTRFVVRDTEASGLQGACQREEGEGEKERVEHK
jgi:hypothetical protein